MSDWLATTDHRIALQDFVAAALWMAVLHDAIKHYRTTMRPLGLTVLAAWFGATSLFFLDRGLIRLIGDHHARIFDWRGPVAEVTIAAMNVAMVLVKLAFWRGWHWRRSD